MGKIQSKSGVVSIPGITLSQTRSDSFDSINTATTTGTERPLIPHSNSMDSLLNKVSRSSNSKSNFPKQQKENGRTYLALTESSSVTTSFSACDRNADFSLSCPETTPTSLTHRSGKKLSRGVSSVLKSQLGNDVGIHQPQNGSDPGNVVGNSQESCLESRDCTRQMEDGLQAYLQGEGAEHGCGPELHSDIIQKLTKEEWRELITYTCSTLGRSLLASILQHPSLLENLMQQGTSDKAMPTHHSTSTTEGLTSKDDAGHTSSSKRRRSKEHLAKTYKLDIESVLRKLREADLGRREKLEKKNLKRTSSLPPLHKVEVGTGPTESHPVGGNSLLFDSASGREEVGGANLRGSSQAEGLTEVSSDQCRSPVEQEGTRNQNGGRHRCAHGVRGHSAHHGQKMRGRSRSDSVRDRNSLVDASLDDDGPGLPENRIRRPRHHHQHQHYICRQCLEEFGSKGWHRGKAAKKGWCRKHSPDQDQVNSSGSGGERSAPVGPAMVLSLDRIQGLERSTEITGEDSGNDDHIRQVAPICREVGLGGGEYMAVGSGKRQHHDLARPHGKNNGTWNHPHGDVNTHLRTSDMDGVGRLNGTSGGGSNMVHVSVTPLSRSGRVSPATDMAVCCLDLGNRNMSQLHHSHSQDGCGLTGREWEEGCHVYLHNHQHFHHIIQHSQP